MFYYFSNNGNGDNWTSVTWTKVTQNTNRTIPNDANDIAVVEGGSNWAKMLVNDDLSLHGYVVGVPKGGSGTVRVQLETANAKTLTFCGSEADPAFFNFSSMYTGDCGIRLGTENGTGNKVLTINVAAKRMNFDWCGDSASVTAPRRGKAEIQWCSAVVTIPEGNTLAFVNDSKVVTDSIVAWNTSAGHISGSGAVVFGQSGGIPISWLKFSGDEFAGDVAVRAGGRELHAVRAGEVGVGLVDDDDAGEALRERGDLLRFGEGAGRRVRVGPEEERDSRLFDCSIVRLFDCLASGQVSRTF